ncbi:MurR/RpiR family transcriptional regulator [Phytohabitans aurantiacus]|jgi:DNA-binding MurR/RpiR family transcriptional regulator|uniref:RpiR family transcriptional regulator n=1 Tax=Phytohabitans aurantiacus TaxID=3016789 RepID=A0ABQ5QZW0_9ACTN|nr:MurR/RpiR family transcriptional regulator [Phytohabitans aurantiacus]GLH99562.1 RpiR family transcriptional regulator [Phytohabitans aurantiacus]
MAVLERVRSRLPELTGALRRVADTVLEDPTAAAHSTIVELAERSGTSPATVTRFCRVLDFGGYADLRLGIAAETGAESKGGWTVDIGREIQPTDSLDRVLSQIMAADAHAMRDTALLLDLAAVKRAAAAIACASRVTVFGVSGSALVGEDVQLSMHRIGVPAWAWTDLHGGLASAALSRPGDVAIGVSHTGRTGETIELLAEAGNHGATTVALTSFPLSPLAELADIVLLTAAQETDFRPDALSARHRQLVVLDLLYVAVHLYRTQPPRRNP